MSVVVDTSALFALLDKRDAHHASAVSFWSDPDAEDLVTHAYVVIESVALVRARLGGSAVQGGATATISAGMVMVNRLTITGSTLRPQSVENKGRMARGLKEKVWPLLETGKVKPIIYKTFPLADAAGAHAELERADHVGKVMMTV